MDFLNKMMRKKVVTILHHKGRMLEFTCPISVGEVLAIYPGHFLCHSDYEAVEMAQLGKVLPSRALLQGGEVYFLLPKPRHGPWSIQPQAPAGRDEQKINQLESSAQNPMTDHGATIKVMLSKRQLVKLVADGSIKLPPLTPNSIPSTSYAKYTHDTSLFNRPVPSVKQNIGSPWSSALESLDEEPLL